MRHQNEGCRKMLCETVAKRKPESRRRTNAHKSETSRGIEHRRDQKLRKTCCSPHRQRPVSIPVRHHRATSTVWMFVKRRLVWLIWISCQTRAAIDTLQWEALCQNLRSRAPASHVSWMRYEGVEQGRLRSGGSRRLSFAAMKGRRRKRKARH